MSNHVSVSNGVKQRGVISPTLYNIYNDHLLNNLQKSGLGCTICLTYVGVLSYADDSVLLAPTESALHKMSLIYVTIFLSNIHGNFMQIQLI